MTGALRRRGRSAWRRGPRRLDRGFESDINWRRAVLGILRLSVLIVWGVCIRWMSLRVSMGSGIVLPTGAGGGSMWS